MLPGRKRFYRPRSRSLREHLPTCTAVVAALLFASPTPSPAAGPRNSEQPVGVAVQPADAAAEAAHAAATTPSRLIVRLREEVDACLSCRLAQRRSLSAIAPGSRLDELNARFGVVGARPLVPSGFDTMRPRSSSVASARWNSMQSRFASRHSRMPVGSRPADFSRTYILELRARPDMAAVAREYASDPAVEYCEPDYVVETRALTNDPYLSRTGSWDQPFADLWGLLRIGAPAAWDSTAGAGVVVAITDTGIDRTHPDIAANAWTNAGEIPGNAIDDDANGYIDDVHGWDFFDNDNDPLDDHGHGTHVAGSVAAVGNNAAGIVGVAYQSQVMAVRGLGTQGFGYNSDLALAILYAVDNGADVINASWGSIFESQILTDALATARAAGVVFVAAAGNSAADARGHYPSGDVNAISVGALNSQDALADFSNFGIGLDVVAPGGGDEPPPDDDEFPRYSILSLHSAHISSANDFNSSLILSNGGAEYLRLAGTSMAAPHVAGVAALVLANDPTFTVDEVRQVLRSSADDIGESGPDTVFGHGVVRADQAVASGRPLVARIAEPANRLLRGPTDVEITGTAAGSGFESYSIDYRRDDDPGNWMPVVTAVTTEVADGVLATWPVADLTDGAYLLRLTAVRGAESFVDLASVTLRFATITEPARRAAIRAEDTVEIRGTAAGGGFVSYMVEYQIPAFDEEPWRTDGLQLAGPADVPVNDGLLATLDVSHLTTGYRYDFRLTVVNGAGTIVKERSGVTIDPTLRAGWPQPLVRVADAEYLTVHDLDGDGGQEILVGSGDEVVVFEHDGSVRAGWPQTTATEAYPLVSTRGSPIVADITGDDAPEVIATNREQILAWDRDGNLLPGFPIDDPYFPTGLNDWITAGDRDGDGKDEIIASSVRGIHVYRGDGSLVGGPIRSEFGVAASSVGDVTGDGRAEILRFDRTAGRARGVMELIDPEYDVLLSERATTKTFAHMSMADIDGDGTLDLISVREKTNRPFIKLNTFALYLKRLKISKFPRPKPRNLVRLSNGQVSFTDWDGDGAAEAVSYARVRREGDSSFTGEDGYILFARERLTTRAVGPAPGPLVNRIYESVTPGGIAIGDIDGDGKQDFVVGTSGNACGLVDCRPHDGTPYRLEVGPFAQSRDGSIIEGFPKPLPQLVSGPDEDTDGDDGTTISLSFGLDDHRAGSPAIADLDGDGLKEIVWVAPGSRALYVWNVGGQPGPLLADWPAYHFDSRHSNAFIP